MTWLVATLAVAMLLLGAWATYRLGFRHGRRAERTDVERLARIEASDRPHRGPMNPDGGPAVVRQARIRRRGFTQD